MLLMQPANAESDNQPQTLHPRDGNILYKSGPHKPQAIQVTRYQESKKEACTQVDNEIKAQGLLSRSVHRRINSNNEQN